MNKKDGLVRKCETKSNSKSTTLLRQNIFGRWISFPWQQIPLRNVSRIINTGMMKRTNENNTSLQRSHYPYHKNGNNQQRAYSYQRHHHKQTKLRTPPYRTLTVGYPLLYILSLIKAFYFSRTSSATFHGMVHSFLKDMRPKINGIQQCLVIITNMRFIVSNRWLFFT